jgi:hypothetical protein
MGLTVATFGKKDRKETIRINGTKEEITAYIDYLRQKEGIELLGVPEIKKVFNTFNESTSLLQVIHYEKE